MIPFKLKELLQLAKDNISCCDQIDPETAIYEVSTNSKMIHDDCLFIALKGQRFDAHAFIPEVATKAKLISSEKTITQLQEQQSCNLVPNSLLISKDNQRTLGLCGQVVRQKSSAKVGAITGSCGKTTVKEMTASILSQSGKTLYTEGNLNNDIGVPLTLLRLEQDHDFAVVEQGASHLEDIARTAEFIEADVALITNVGNAHIEGFGSSRGVYQGKSEILDKVFTLFKQQSSKNCLGIGIVPHDSPWFSEWQKDYHTEYQDKRLLSFGESKDATMCVSNIEETQDTLGNNHLSFHLSCQDERYLLECDVCLDTLGRHNAINAAGAALLALVMGVKADTIKTGLQATKLLKGRLVPQQYQGLTIIDDAYNASFDAVIAAIDTLHKMQSYRVFVFGDMGELGNSSIDLHQKVGCHASDKVDALLCIGEQSKFTVRAMQDQSKSEQEQQGFAQHFASHAKLNEYLFKLIKDKQESTNKNHVTCLIKGSHAMNMESIVIALQDFAKGL